MLSDKAIQALRPDPDRPGTKHHDRDGLKQKQQELIDKSKDLLGTPPLPPGGNGHGPAVATTPPPGDGVPGPIDISTNGSQPQPQDQTKGADDHG